MTQLAILENKPPRPGARALSGEVLSLAYVHVDDGKAYEHDFGPGVELWALKDGSILLRGRGKRLWEDME